jgi:hypothetical protein
MKIKELKEIISTIEKKKAIIAKERDELRKLHDDLGDLLGSFDCGIEDLNEGIRCIVDAIESISEVV